MTLLNVLGVLGVLYVLNVLDMPMDASLSCWALFILSVFFSKTQLNKSAGNESTRNTGISSIKSLERHKLELKTIKEGMTHDRRL